MPKHTLGPWKLDKAGVNVVDPTENREYVLAECHGATINELHANARLIAAAPDLLEALHGITKTTCALWDMLDALQGTNALRRHELRDIAQAIDRIARAAISKAEGGA